MKLKYFHAHKCTTKNQIYTDHKLLLCTKCFMKTDIVMVETSPAYII